MQKCAHINTKIERLIGLLEIECDLHDSKERNRERDGNKNESEKIISALWEYYHYRSQKQRLRYVKLIINVKILQH